MDWLTREEIQKAAKAGKLPAVQCTKKHWWQIATATAKELKAAYKADLVGIGQQWCALCIRYSTCRSCVLRHSGGCGWPLYQAAVDMFFVWQKGRRPHSAFTKAARKLHKRLCREEKKLMKRSK